MSRGVLVTGASGYLGAGLVEVFAREGWRVFGGYREMPPSGGEGILPVPLDLRRDEDLAAAVERILSEDLEIYALVANASDRPSCAEDWASVSREMLHGLFDVDVVGHFLLARRLFEATRARRRRLTVLFVSSIYGLGGVHEGIYPDGMRPTPPQYSVAKAALVGLTRDLAGRWGPAGVRVNCLVPGGIRRSQPPDFVERYSALTQLGRMAEVGEVATVAELLCSERASYVTGQIVGVDGGWTAW